MWMETELVCVWSIRATVWAQQHLLVSLQLLDERAFMKQRLQPLLGVIVAELLKGSSPLLLSQSRVLESWSVNNQQRAQRVLTGLQSPEGQRGAERETNIQWNFSSSLGDTEKQQEEWHNTAERNHRNVKNRAKGGHQGFEDKLIPSHHKRIESQIT